MTEYTFLPNCGKLALASIGFTVHYAGYSGPAKSLPPTHYVITIESKNLTNDQLKVVTEIGGSLDPDGNIMILGTFEEDDD
jgi:hypothetical protein